LRMASTTSGSCGAREYVLSLLSFFGDAEDPVGALRLVSVQ
jgi:hypothetical protein